MSRSPTATVTPTMLITSIPTVRAILLGNRTLMYTFTPGWCIVTRTTPTFTTGTCIDGAAPNFLEVGLFLELRDRLRCSPSLVWAPWCRQCFRRRRPVWLMPSPASTGNRLGGNGYERLFRTPHLAHFPLGLA